MCPSSPSPAGWVRICRIWGILVLRASPASSLAPCPSRRRSGTPARCFVPQSRGRCGSTRRDAGRDNTSLEADRTGMMEERSEMKEPRKTAMDFWSQARADLATAVTLLDAGVYYASVFFSQQAAEKALKGATVDKQGRVPKGHN